MNEAMNTKDRDWVREALERAKPFLRKLAFAAAARELEMVQQDALRSHAVADAASISSIRGEFLALAGDGVAALSAYEKAERLDPNGHHSLSVADFLLSQGSVEAARDKVEAVLNEDHQEQTVRHLACSLLGRCFVQVGDLTKAVECLREAHKIAKQAQLDPQFWDHALPRTLAETPVEPENYRSYVLDLLAAARDQGDSAIERILMDLLPPVQE